MRFKVLVYGALKALFRRCPFLIGLLPRRKWRVLFRNALFEERHVGECQDM